MQGYPQQPQQQWQPQQPQQQWQPQQPQQQWQQQPEAAQQQPEVPEQKAAANVCPRCGAPLNEGSGFCVNCGLKL